MPDFSYQLYSSRNFPPIDKTLAVLAAAGYRQVEGFGGAIDAAGGASGLRTMLDANGLTMPTAHFGLSAVEANADAVIADAKALGVACIIIPWLPPEERPTTAAGWTALGARVEKAVKPLVAAGFEVAYHNHDFELIETEGQMPLDLLLAAAPSLKLELDLAWTFVAGQAPEAWVSKYSNRLVSVHLKDRAAAGANADEDGWADLGKGEMNWGPIIAAVKASSARHFIMEHDNPSDHVRFAMNSIAFARTLWN